MKITNKINNQKSKALSKVFSNFSSLIMVYLIIILSEHDGNIEYDVSNWNLLSLGIFTLIGSFIIGSTIYSLVTLIRSEIKNNEIVIIVRVGDDNYQKVFNNLLQTSKNLDEFLPEDCNVELVSIKNI